MSAKRSTKARCMSFERLTDDYRKILDSNFRERASHALNRRRNRQQCWKILIRRHRSFSQNRFRTQSHRLFVTNSTITIRITKIRINTSIIISWTINSINSISEQREIINQKAISVKIFIFTVNQTAIIIISIYQTTILIVSINQTSIIIFNFWIIEQTTIILDWTSQRSISRSIHQMRFVNKILSTEKITTINLAKIIHRVITSIDSRVSHIIFIINLTSCSHIIITSFYLINSKEKIVSWINQIDCINQNRKRSWKRACKSD